MADFGTIPANATLKPTSWKLDVDEQELKDFHTLLKLSKIGPATYENQTTDAEDFRGHGIRRDWLQKAKAEWETNYNFRTVEARINKFANYKVPIQSGYFTFDLHFIGLFSKRPDAAPYLLLHGWPGSVLEFLGVLDELTKTYTPETLPVNIVVPSLPGYGFSNGPPLDRDFTLFDSCDVVDRLMTGLGFTGYIAQGGDVGAFMCRVLGAKHEAVKAVHLNYCLGADDPKDEKIAASLSKQEQYGLKRTADWIELGSAYAREHGTRPATVGLALSASPLALLAWVSEKFIAWSDTTPTMTQILDAVSIYWFTESFPRAIYPYRHFFGPNPTFFQNEADLYIKKPVGYSYFPQELAPIPRAWVERTCDLVWYQEHTEGGHFAALEKPTLFTKDILDFAAEVWPKVK